MRTGKMGNIPLGMVIGWLSGMVCALTLVAALSQMILSETLPESSVGVGGAVILGISAALDALVSALVAKQRWLQVCLGAGGLFYLTMLTLGLVVFGGPIQGAWIGLLTTAGASIAVGLVALKGEKGVAKKGQFRRYGKLVQIPSRGK